jgi:prevent-host-death family protein
MGSVGCYEAKTNFSELVARVEEGESILITKHGKAVARLVPVALPDAGRRNLAMEILEELRNRSELGTDIADAKSGNRR